MLVLSKDRFKDTSNISVTSNVAGYPLSHAQIDKKSNTWKSTSNAEQVITITWANPIESNFVGICHHNFDQNTITRVRYYQTAANTNPIYDSGNASVGYCFDPPNGFTNNSQSFAYGGGNYWTKQTPEKSIKKIVINLSNSTPDQFYELSRIVIGKTISPKFDADVGVNLEIIDESKNVRTEAGDTVTDIRPVYKELNFNLGYIVEEDRNNILNIMRQVGCRNPVFVSLEGGKSNSIDKSHMIYGRFDALALDLNSLYKSATSVKVIEY